ncbi:MAG: orotidine 5'-phosphate decarboxylase [Herpetosiphonaceae bacterium]|nr:orotidine 5'-phosphate decarboxylase [Herpetosiphonaceae bacterium]
MRTTSRPIVQISLDLINIEEALETARIAVAAGVDWLEAGTPLLLAEGLQAVKALRRAFPAHPIVADVKIMDGGYLETEMVAKAGATHVVVMAQAHRATIKEVVRAARDYGILVMGDDLGTEDKPAAARMMQDLGVDYIVHHVGYDERRDLEVQAGHGGRMPSPLDELAAVVAAVEIPVQAVGGLSVEQAIGMPQHGAPLVVLGAPLVIDAEAFHVASNDLGALLREIVVRIRGGEA